MDKPEKENFINVDNFIDAIKKNNLIKIPDVYQVQMDFDSLLPNNFNSYLFNFTHNLDMATQYRENIPYHSAVINKDAINGMTLTTGGITLEMK